MVMHIIYGHSFSSYTWKALIGFYAFDIPVDFRNLDPADPGLAENSAFVQTAHPAGKFPVLRDGDTVIVEATSIIEYLAATQPRAAALIPADPAKAVIARMIDRIFDNYVMGSMQSVVDAYIANADNPDPEAVKSGKAALQRAYHWLEDWLARNTLPPHVSLVTCAAAPSLFYADWVDRIPDDCPRVAALRAELLALPAVKRCVDDARPYRHYFPLGAPDRD